MNEVAYSLPYAQGLQLIWADKVARGELIKALHPDSSSSSKEEIERVKSLIG